MLLGQNARKKRKADKRCKVVFLPAIFWEEKNHGLTTVVKSFVGSFLRQINTTPDVQTSIK